MLPRASLGCRLSFDSLASSCHCIGLLVHPGSENFDCDGQAQEKFVFCNLLDGQAQKEFACCDYFQHVCDESSSAYSGSSQLIQGEGLRLDGWKTALLYIRRNSMDLFLWCSQRRHNGEPTQIQ